jgi:tripartite-type tricarboxylate transporter receptor subunit TctC
MFPDLFTPKLSPSIKEKGKQMRIIVGASAGGFYDCWARLLARFIPKYVPGNPSVIVQTMPGRAPSPNMRPEHVRSLREVFMKTVKDPAFVAEAKNKKLDIDPSSGEEVEMLGREVMSQPPEVVERLKKLLGK